MNILKTIQSEYLKEIFKINIDDLINNDLVIYAQKIVDDNFREYIKDNSLENDIKRAGFHYFIAIYLLIKTKNTNGLNKELLKNLIMEKNNVENLSKSLLNFDFYLGSCGIEAQNLALNKDENI